MSDQVLHVDKEDYLASGLLQLLFFDKEQLVSQTTLFPSLGYLKLTELFWITSIREGKPKLNTLSKF